ncbi:FadR family transcriptional regulator [Micrococcales bacterium 31B]|nr:FadR family transcriptional regulator [Micrococcales bacterium 31B]
MVEATTLSERLSRQIIATIRDHNLEVGQALPSARALAERFDVTVPTVREALRRLEATDAIELRHGSGTYVGPSIDRRILAGPYYDPADLVAAAELLDARIAIEPGIARLAAERRGDSELAALDASLANALQAESAGVDRNFHTRLAAASRNRALSETLESLLTIYARAQQVARLNYDREHDHAEHHAIVTAIRDADPDAAARLTERHLRNIRTALLGEAPAPAGGHR